MKKEEWVEISLSKLMGKISGPNSQAISNIKTNATEYLSHTWDEIGEVDVEIEESINPLTEVKNHSSGRTLYADNQMTVLAKKEPNRLVVIFILIINLFIFANSFLTIPSPSEVFLHDVQTQSVFIDTESPRDPMIALYKSDPTSDLLNKWTAVSGVYVADNLSDLLSGININPQI